MKCADCSKIITTLQARNARLEDLLRRAYEPIARANDEYPKAPYDSWLDDCAAALSDETPAVSRSRATAAKGKD